MRVLVISLMLLCGMAAKAQEGSLYRYVMYLQEKHRVHFVYDAGLDLNKPYRGRDVTSMPLKPALRRLFAESGITFEIHGKNILLRQARRKDEVKWFSVKGTITDSVGERLINASVYDYSTKSGALSDEHGRYILSLPEGKRRIRVTYFGVKQKYVEVDLRQNTTLNFVLNSAFDIDEVVVRGDMNSPVLTTQTGKRVFTEDDIKTEFSLLSSPDLMKTLQRTSGVQNGAELTSGLFVHGGNGDENLFLIDGTPLYQTNHSLGLFSSFNVDVIKNVDFYKSGFPARYSGRVSSITDVRTRDGNMREIHGVFSLGLLDDRLQLEGPLKKDKTSFNIALRRSWIDLLLKPVYALMNSSKEDGEKFSFGYAFHDLNAKVTHRLVGGHKLWLSIYSGRDSYSIKDESKWTDYVTTTGNRFRWGNLNATVGGDFLLTPWLSSTMALVGTYSYSNHDADEDDSYHAHDGIIHRNSLDIRYNTTRMYDIGLKTDFHWTPVRWHHVRFGGTVIHHGFNPQTSKQSFYFGNPGESVDTSHVTARTSTSSEEVTLYLEDEMSVARHLSLNIGCSYTLFHVRNKTYHLLDPRLAVKWQTGRMTSLKFSYTHMSQSVHRIAGSFLEIPSDFWVPTTDRVRPTGSSQLAGGVYAQVGNRWTLTLEGFYKQTDHLLQYRHWMGLQPPAAYWEENVTEGRGRAYGLEVDARYQGSRLTGELSYTLSFSKRLFPELYDGWYRDQFDNRHKLDVMTRYRLTKKVSAYAAFTFKSGNRMTVPVATSLLPLMPDEEGQMGAGYVYAEPNNFGLPAYHRLDLGCDFHHTTSKGREVIWNVSLYNAYCHLNTMYTRIRMNEDGSIVAKAKGFIPVIPSVSYTVKF